MLPYSLALAEVYRSSLPLLQDSGFLGVDLIKQTNRLIVQIANNEPQINLL